MNEDLKKLMSIPMPRLPNYYLELPGQEDIKVWAQMFFDDGSVTPGRYISRSIYDNPEFIEELAKQMLDDTCRKEGVLFIWGAGRVYAKKAQLLLLTRGASKGSETLRLRNL